MSETKITYYEDEWFDASILNKNECTNYIELMKKFLKDGKYCPQRGTVTSPPYYDPDGSDKRKMRTCSYYWELTQFLNKREIWLERGRVGETRYKYIAPNNCKKLEEVEEKGQEKGSDTNEIIIKGKNNEEKFRLKSDQFGFSVGEKKREEIFDKHPYGYLCKLVEKETKEEKDRVYGVIAECIYHTRTLGGGFLWEKGIWGVYNENRGKSYIEDRVDLTLLEIKHLFKWIELEMPEENAQKKEAVDLFNRIGDKAKDKKKSVDILYYTIKNKIENKEKTTLDYIKWLQHFGTFENYIKFFCFDEFVDSKYKTWMPFDIMESKLVWNDKSKSLSWDKVVFLEDPTKYKQRKKYSVYHPDRTAAELEQMIENVRIMTLARSYRMQKVIDGTSD